MKIVIIGGGVSGLAAGIYAQKCGFQSEIYEKNPNLGGMCSYWMRHGFLIDNCVHWLCGTNPDADIHKVWKDLNILGDGIDVIQHPSFFQIEQDGQTVNIWQNVERTRRELKQLSPEDSDAIDNFIDTINKYKSVFIPTEPKEMMSFGYILRMIWKMKKVLLVNGIYSKMSLEQYASCFKHPLLRRMCTAYFPETYNAMSMFYTYATFCSGNGGLPKGGSKGMIERMTGLYERLGGKIFTSHEATEITVEGKKAKGVKFLDGSFVEADWIVPACDSFETFSNLLPVKYTEPFFAEKYKNTEKFRVYNSANCYYALEAKAEDIMPQNTMILDCNINILGNVRTEFVMKNFDYEPSFAPEGKSVLQVLISLYEKDFDRWKDLYDNDREAYKEAKRQLDLNVKTCIEEHFPEMKGKLKSIDVATPVTHYRYCKAYKGAYMSFVLTPFVKKEMHNGRIKDIENIALAGQWLQMPGGLPNAAITGKFAIQRICKSIGKKFL